MISFTVDGTVGQIDAEADKRLLWALREDLNIVGSKFGCGVAACGACTVHVDGSAVRSCSIPIDSVAGCGVVTIEGLGQGALHAVPEPPAGRGTVGPIDVASGVMSNGDNEARG
ncbi:MAG: 2Fe-2S iron-sulfur cluster-binding protein [Reyranellaceae bacterium]